MYKQQNSVKNPKKYSGTAGALFFLLHSAPILIIYGQGGGGEAADGPAGDAAPGPVQTSDRQHQIQKNIQYNKTIKCKYK